MALRRALLISPVVIVLFAVDLFAQGTFVYTNDNVEGFNTITGFSVGSNGTLVRLPGFPLLTGGRASGVGAYAANRIRIFKNLLFASNSVSLDISVFSISPGTGALTPVSGSPFATQVGGGNGISLALTSDGRFLFAGGVDSSTIEAFTVASDGALTPSAPPVASGGSELLGINTSNDHKFLAVTNFFGFSGNTLALFSIDNNGMLTPVPNPPIQIGGVAATSVEFNCASNLLFVGEHSGPTTTDVFNVASNGIVSPVQGSPFIQSSGNIGNSGQVVLLSPNERFLFVSNQFSGTVTVWSVAQSGSLTLVPGSSFDVGGNPNSSEPAGMATNKDGTLLFVTTDLFGGTRAVSVFRIDSATGVLTLLPGSPFDTGQGEGLRSIAAFPAKACVSFDLCLQDESNGNVLQVNLTTGDYQFTNCMGLTMNGVGSIITKGCYVTLQVNGPDRRILARLDNCGRTGTASIHVLSTGATFTILDRNTGNNTCSCSNR